MGYSTQPLIPEPTIPPIKIIEGDNYKITILSTTNPGIQDSSDAPFSLVLPGTTSLLPLRQLGFASIFDTLTAKAQTENAPLIKILSPNGGEQIAIGSTYDIKWESKNLPTDTVLKIILSKSFNVRESLRIVNKEVGETIKELRADPVVIKTVTEVAAPIAVSVSAASAGSVTVTASAGSAPFAINLSDFFQTLSLARFYILAFIRFKRRKPWGGVIDKLSGKPVPSAMVQIYDAEFKKLKDAQLTDEQGRFGALVGPGEYYIKVTKRGYRDFQSKIINISSPNQILNLELSISPLYEEWSFEYLKRINILNTIKRFIEAINPFLLAAGTLISAISLIIVPSTLNYVTFAVYIFLDILKIYFAFHLIRPFGMVTDSTTNAPLPLTVVRVFEANRNWLLATKVTDDRGRFTFLLAPGKYYITFSRADFTTYVSEPLVIKRGELPTLNVKMAHSIAYAAAV